MIALAVTLTIALASAGILAGLTYKVLTLVEITPNCPLPEWMLFRLLGSAVLLAMAWAASASLAVWASISLPATETIAGAGAFLICLVCWWAAFTRWFSFFFFRSAHRIYRNRFASA